LPDLRNFLELLKTRVPADLVSIRQPIDPDYEVTAIVRGVEGMTNPVVIFEKKFGFRASDLRSLLFEAHLPTNKHSHSFPVPEFTKGAILPSP